MGDRRCDSDAAVPSGPGGSRGAAAMPGPSYMMPIATLWHSADPNAWGAALEHYWDLVKAPNQELEQRLNALDLDRLRQMDAHTWYDFLQEEYFRWKYTAPNRYGSTTKWLRRFVETRGVEGLDQFRRCLLTL